VFLILSVCEAGFTAIRGSHVIGASTTERWFSSQAFVDAARERKVAASRGESCVQHESSETPHPDCAESP